MPEALPDAMPAALPMVELQAPDITPWQVGNIGVPWVHVLQGRG